MRVLCFCFEGKGRGGEGGGLLGLLPEVQMLTVGFAVRTGSVFVRDGDQQRGEFKGEFFMHGQRVLTLLTILKYYHAVRDKHRWMASARRVE